MNVNHITMTIEMTKVEAKAAEKFGSDAYKDLVEARNTFSNYKIVIKKATRKRSTFKGLTYEYMKKYIAKKENKQLMVEFETMIGLENGKKAEFADSLSYGEVKEWFLRQFPEISEFNNKVDQLRKANKEAIANKKTA